MKDSDRILLDGLALVTDLREDEWAQVVKATEDAGGVREVGGQARVEIERAGAKARTLVAKHPGHADQSVHGGGRGKGGGTSSAPAPSGGGGRDEPARAERMADQFDSMSAKANDPKTAVHWAEAATGARTVASARSKKEANQAVRDLNVKVLNAQINNNVGLDRAQGRRDGAEAAYEARFGEKHTASAGA